MIRGRQHYSDSVLRDCCCWEYKRVGRCNRDSATTGAQQERSQKEAQLTVEHCGNSRMTVLHPQRYSETCMVDEIRGRLKPRVWPLRSACCNYITGWPTCSVRTFVE